MRTFFRSLVIAAAIGFASVAAAGAQNAPAPDRQLITMDFQDVEITVLAKFISEITGRNFILDEKVRGKVTVISPTKITVDEAYRVFQSILEVKGFTTVAAGPAIKIVPVTDAKESGSPLATPGSRGAEFVTQLVPLAFVDPQSLVPVLQPMVSKNGLISAYESTNTLILIDTAENVDRLMEIVSELDVEVPDRGIEIIRLENAFAQEIAATLEQALQAEGERASAAPRVRVAQPARGQPAADPANIAAGGEPFRVIPDERTNSIVVLAGPVQMRTIKSLVRELDRPFQGIAKINVYRLRYANAVEMVDVLGQLIGGGGGGGGGSLGSTTSSRRTTRASMGFGGGRSSTSRGLGSRTSGGLGGGALGDGGGSGRTSQQATSASGSGGGEFVGEVNVTADPYTNSLVVSAGPQDYSVLERVIAELDVPRRQVLVEAIILEVSLDKAKALGFELQGAVALGNSGVGLGRVNLDSLNAALTNPGALSGLVAAAASNQTVTLPDGTTVPAQVALLTALQNDSDVNVLSAPTILTSDNQEAEIVVAQNIPFIATRASDTTNLSNVFATVERQDVGITLRITPQISEGDVVRLDIYEEVSAVVPNPPVDPNIAGPTTTVRSASTTVVAMNGSTVSVGGLISDTIVNQESKVPYLGDIPVLGNFFKTNNDIANKVNLLIFLTPRIIRDEVELRAASLAERDKLKQSVGPRLAPSGQRALARSSWDRKPGPLAPQRGPLWAPPATEVPPRAPEPYALPPDEPPAPPVAPSAPPPVAALPPSAERVPPPRAAEPAISPEMVVLPRTGVRYVVLLSYLEQGTPPAGFETQNGFLTVYVPDTSGEFFVKGGAYDYAAPGYEAKFICLEVFPDASSALAVYPEGQRIDGATVHWRPIGADPMRQILAGTSPWKRTR